MERERYKKAMGLDLDIDTFKEKFKDVLGYSQEKLDKADIGTISFIEKNGDYIGERNHHNHFTRSDYKIPTILLKDIIQKAQEYYKEQLEVLENKFKQL